MKKKFTVIFQQGALATLLVVGGALAGCQGQTHVGSSGAAAQTIDKVPTGAVDLAVERYRVPVGDSPVEGPGDAKVTIVEFSDFQCPFCGRVEGTLDQVKKTYGSQVRIVWKNNPLPFHQHAMPAALLAESAAKQGKFWEMHEVLFKNQRALEQADLDKYAQQVGLDAAKVKTDVADPAVKKKVADDMALAAQLGARGTPAFFINGRLLSGAQPFDAFKKIIDEELKAADKAMAAGVKQAQVYDALTKNGKAGSAMARPNQPTNQAVYKVPVGNSPVRGNADAEVTIVMFSDFQCPFCGRVEPTLAELEKTYGDKLRIVWKNNPLPFHQHAMPAALAAEAAAAQGKFWEMHDLLFKNQNKLEQADLDGYAQQIGLDMSKYKAAIASEDTKKIVAADMALAQQFGARGTPAFFINGKNLSGAQPIASFKTVIDAAIKDADAAIAKGVKKADVYAELTKSGLDKVAAPAAPPADNVVYKALLGDAPVHGAKHAKVTIVEYSDFQCPFCSRVEPTLAEVLKAYPNDVRIAFKQFPLPFHQHAHLAAEAALAAKAQGKFWEMHEILFKNQNKLERADLENYAQQIGLNMNKFKAALDAGTYKAKVDEEEASGQKIGARGTPSFFINGKKFVGAQPIAAFKAKIDEEIKAADAFMGKNHVKVDKLYDELMKTATEGQAPAKAAAPEPEDKTVYKVDPGNGPTKGPKNAKVQIVLFSDFQCPFCSRVEPTLKQIMDKYNGKVRLTWRNYPLPFHPNARPAAEAAMAAAAQGKFWEMHDKLFANQRTLDRQHFEQFAQELGLDMGKFKAALDANSGKAAIDADVAYANSLPGGGMGTPTAFINGHKISGAYPFETFAKVIDAELAKK